jgi:hypothetical protein
MSRIKYTVPGISEFPEFEVDKYTVPGISEFPEFPTSMKKYQKRKAGVSAPVDQQGQAQPAAGFRLFIDGGEVGLDRSFGDLEIERNFKVRLALGHQFGNLMLRAGQTGQALPGSRRDLFLCPGIGFQNQLLYDLLPQPDGAA